MGFGGNLYPDYITPTVISVADAVGRAPSGRAAKGIPELDFSIGDEAIANQAVAQVKYPLRHGQVDDWDLMEKFYEQCYYKYLRCEPEEHLCILVC
jgi:actin-related protein 3